MKHISPSPRTVVAYLRVSTREQGRSGLGIDAQSEAIARFAAAEGYAIVAEFVEVETGKGSNAIERRPQLAAALAEARRHGCAVAVFQARSPVARRAFHQRSHGASGPVRGHRTGRGCRTVHAALLAAFAERERKVISERTVAALAAAKARGTVLGNPRLAEARIAAHAGSRAGADAFAATVAPAIRSAQAAGAKSLRAIAEALEARGVPTQRGGRWDPRGVAEHHREARARCLK